MNLKCESYDRLALESLAHIMLIAPSYKGKEVLITFRKFNNDMKLSLGDFHDLLHLLVHDGASGHFPENYKPGYA